MKRHTCSSHRSEERARAAGFNLLQCIGVLAILSVLMAMILPNVFNRLDQAAVTREENDLGAITNALTQSILRQKVVPAYSGISTSIASELSMPLSRVTASSRGFQRAFIVDRNFSLGGGLPYTQTTNGTAKPANARIAIVSSQNRALPIGSTNNLSDAEFQAIWDTPEGGFPASTTWTDWGGRNDLHIKKLNLEPLFHRLILIDHDTSGNPLFSIDNTNKLSFTNTFGWSAYYLDGTVLGLYHANGTLLTRYVMKRSISYVLEYGAWHAEITAGLNANTNSTGFASEAAEFFNAQWNASAQHGANQLGVLSAMYTYMLDYTLWATECPRFSRRGATLAQVPEYLMLDAVGKNAYSGFLFQFSDDLVK